MLPFLNMLVCFISIKCYGFFPSYSLRYTYFKGATLAILILNKRKTNPHCMVAMLKIRK